MTEEGDIQYAIRLALGAVRGPDGLPVCLMFRNQAGFYVVKEDKHGKPCKPRKISYGLKPKGSPDLVGALKPNARWFCLEVKSAAGRKKQEQVEWLELIRKFGGFGCFVRSVPEALAALDRALRGESE